MDMLHYDVLLIRRNKLKRYLHKQLSLILILKIIPVLNQQHQTIYSKYIIAVSSLVLCQFAIKKMLKKQYKRFSSERSQWRSLGGGHIGAMAFPQISKIVA